jgi:hypothetical protein
MEIAVWAIVGGFLLWVTIGGMIGAHYGNRELIVERRRRYVARMEPELLDKFPERWVAEAEEEFEVHQQYIAQRAETQRQRSLGMIRKAG